MVADRSRFIELFEKMTSSAREQKEVAEEFRSLTKRTLPSRAPIRTSSILTEKHQSHSLVSTEREENQRA